MPHVAINRLILKVCLRKRPFPNRQEASADRPEHFEVYECPVCKQWHRASREEFKAEREQEKQRHLERRKKIGKKKRQIFRHFQDELPV